MSATTRSPSPTRTATTSSPTSAAASLISSATCSTPSPISYRATRSQKRSCRSAPPSCSRPFSVPAEPWRRSGSTRAGSAAVAAFGGAAIATGLSGGNLGQVLKAGLIAGATAFAGLGSVTSTSLGAGFDAGKYYPRHGRDGRLLLVRLGRILR